MINKGTILFFIIGAFFLTACFKKNNNFIGLNQSRSQHFILYHEILSFDHINDTSISDSIFYSPPNSLFLNSNTENSLGFSKSMADISYFRDIDSMSISFKYFLKSVPHKLNLVWLIENNQQKVINYNAIPLNDVTTGAWDSLMFGFNIKNEWISKDNKLVIYLWNQGNNKLWLDDFEYKLYGVKHVDDKRTDSLGFNYYYDFETANADIKGSEKIKKNSISYSGQYVCDLSDGAEYGISVKKPLSHFGNTPISTLGASIWVYPLQNELDLNLTFIVTNKNKKDFTYWFGKSTAHGNFPAKQWTKLNSALNLPTDILSIDDDIEVGIWNKGKNKVIIDDLRIVYGKETERISAPNQQISSNLSSSAFDFKYYTYEALKVNTFETYRPTDVVLNAFFNKTNDSRESILHISNQKAQMLHYNIQSQSFEPFWEITADTIFNNNDNAFSCGDFDNNGVDDLLVIHRISLKWYLLSFNKDIWSITQSGNNFPEKWLNLINNAGVNKNLIRGKSCCISYCNGKNIEVLYLDKKLWVENTLNVANNKGDVLYDEKDSKYLKFNNTWRFDFKEIMLNNNQMVLMHPIDFKGFPQYSNPKYYEHVKILNGYFTNKLNKQLLVFSFNCMTNDNTCSEIENNSVLPNKISLYKYE